MSDLARRAVACPRWRWMERMRVIYDGAVDYVRWVDDNRWIGLEDVGVNVYTGAWRTPSSLWEPDESGDECPPLPDLSDPATLGCLLALIREAWCDPSLCVVFDHDDGRWNVGRWEDGLVLRGRGGASESEALVNALEGAP